MFQIGDYNEELQKNFDASRAAAMALKYPEDTVAFVVISQSHTLEIGDADQRLKNAVTSLKQVYEI